MSTFTARGGPGEVTLAPGAPGDVAAIELSGQPFFVQSSSYLAGDASLSVDTKWGGAKSFFSGEGLFVLMVQGQGLLLVSSLDRKSTRLNSSHSQISYAVFCLKKKIKSSMTLHVYINNQCNKQ